MFGDRGGLVCGKHVLLFGFLLIFLFFLIIKTKREGGSKMVVYVIISLNFLDT